jgi:transcriptional regulator with XRE-family HTH domain
MCVYARPISVVPVRCALSLQISVKAGPVARFVPQNRRVKIDEYLDAVKAALRCATDSQLALRLRVLQSRISNYRTGRTLPDLQMARLIAAALNLRSGTVVSDIRRERARRSAADRGKTALA